MYIKKTVKDKWMDILMDGNARMYVCVYFSFYFIFLMLTYSQYFMS